jgi:hypothetical protein
MNIEIVSAAAIQPNTGAAGVVFTGDSLTVKNAVASKGVDILAMWQTNQVAGFGQLVFPTGHDTTRGYRAGAAVGINPGQFPFGYKMALTPQELLSVTIAGSNVAGDLEQLSMLIRYGDMPGINARLMTAQAVESKAEKYTTIEQSIASVAGPGYSGEVAINTTTDLLLANRDYAVIGMKSRTAVHALTLRGPDLGNVRVGCPGVLRDELTSQWFSLQSRMHNEPLIPVINSGNKNATFIGVATDENAGTFLVTLFLALLK